MKRVCFDHLSGAPIAPAVMEAMRPWFSERFAGTGAVHSGGVAARGALDAAREQAAKFLNAASPEEIIFTSSGTESINLAIKGCALANRKRGQRIVVSAIEHPAVLQSIDFLETLGFEALRVAVSTDGQIDPGAIREALNDQTILICAHAGHHDIGTMQNLAGMGDLAAERGIDFFVDATYAGGWIPLNAKVIGASFIAIAPHRFHGPKGVGVLYKQRRARILPLIHGGAQELGWRAGTENIPGIVGAGVACEEIASQIPARIAHTSALQHRLWTGLKKSIDEIRLNGPEPGPLRLPNSLNVSFAGLEGEGLALALDMKGFEITSGQACATKASKLPAVLAALGVPEKFGPGTIIASFDSENTTNEIDHLLETMSKAVERLRSMEVPNS